MDLFSGPSNTALAIEPEPDLGAELNLLPQMEPWASAFFRNLRDSLLRPRPATDVVTLEPGEFWPDVFVNRAVPWRGFFESGLGHALFIFAIWGLTVIWPVRTQLTPARAFDQSQVIYFSPSEYLPPLDTGESKPAESTPGDPEYAKQPILSVPPEADNHHQTIVSPPDVHLSQDIETPNIVSWADHSVAVPLAATNRDAPALNSLTVPVVPPAPDVHRDDARSVASLAPNVVAPAPDIRNTDSRTLKELGAAIVPPPPDANAARESRSMQARQSNVVPPPPIVQLAAQRIGELTVAPSNVIVPAPRVALPAQRSLPALEGTTKAVIAPPPSLDSAANGTNAQAARAGGSGGPMASGTVIPPPPSAAQGGDSGGAQRLIALGLHPAPVPPPAASGNRRGNFAATPEGKAGAAGTPATASNRSASAGNAGAADSGPGSGRINSAPAGLHVGAPPNTSTTPVPGGSHSSPDVVNPNVFASNYSGVPSLPRSRTEPSTDTAKTPLEHKVFGDRRVYSMTLNMPNLNSAGGSWVVRFAQSDTSASDTTAASGELTAPVAVHKVDPAYPLELMRQNVAGTVTLRAVIGADGNVSKIEVLQGVDERLDHFACEALRHWRFFPATRDGNPVDLDAVVMIPFHPILQKQNY